MPLVTNHNK